MRENHTSLIIQTFMVIALIGLCLIQANAQTNGLLITEPQGFTIANQQSPITIKWEVLNDEITSIDLLLVNQKGEETVLAAAITGNDSYLFSVSQQASFSGEYYIKIKDTQSEKSSLSHARLFIVSKVEEGIVNDGNYFALVTQHINRHAFETVGAMLRFKLRESQTKESTVIAQLIDQNNATQVKRVYIGLKKNYGDNCYTLDLADEVFSNISFELNKNYYLKIHTPDHKDLALKFKYVEASPVNVLINHDAITVSCDGTITTEIHYKAVPTGGNDFYQLVWYLSPTPYIEDAIRTQKFDRVAKENVNEGYGDISASSATTTKFMVLDDLSYYVILKVTDRCGQVGQVAYHVTCQETEGQPNSVTFTLTDINTTSGD